MTSRIEDSGTDNAASRCRGHVDAPFVPGCCRALPSAVFFDARSAEPHGTPFPPALCRARNPHHDAFDVRPRVVCGSRLLDCRLGALGGHSGRRMPCGRALPQTVCRLRRLHATPRPRRRPGRRDRWEFCCSRVSRLCWTECRCSSSPHFSGLARHRRLRCGLFRGGKLLGALDPASLSPVAMLCFVRCIVVFPSPKRPVLLPLSCRRQTTPLGPRFCSRRLPPRMFPTPSALCFGGAACPLAPRRVFVHRRRTPDRCLPFGSKHAPVNHSAVPQTACVGRTPSFVSVPSSPVAPRRVAVAEAGRNAFRRVSSVALEASPALRDGSSCRSPERLHSARVGSFPVASRSTSDAVLSARHCCLSELCFRFVAPRRFASRVCLQERCWSVL